MKFWAYKHIDGGIHIKRYNEGLAYARESIDDAYESNFVAEVLEPFEAANWNEAEALAAARLKNLATAEEPRQ